MLKNKDTLNNIEDIDLIKKSREGDELARETLLRKYKTLVCSIIRPYYLHGGDDEDLIQEGLIAVNTAINHYNLESKASFSTFAYSCIHNRILDLIRQSKALNVLDEEINLNDSKNFEEDIILKQLVEDTKEVVEEKGTKTDKLILDMFLEGSSYKEIANKIGKDSKFVDNKLQKIRKIILNFSKEWK